jgi:hypothetical protein
VNRLSASFESSVNQALSVEVAVTDRSLSDHNHLISQAGVLSVPFSFSSDSYNGNGHLVGGAGDPQGDFPTVGYQQFLKGHF